MTGVLVRMRPNPPKDEINSEQFEALLNITGERAATVVRKALLRYYQQVPQELIDAAQKEIDRIKNVKGSGV